MARASTGPKFRLYGPDTKFGATRRATFTTYKWYIVSRAGGKRERATGLGLDATTEQKAQALIEFLADQQRETAKASGPTRPDSVSVYDVLLMYGEGHGSEVSDPVRLGQRLSSLMKWWKHRPLSDVTASNCREYATARREGESARRVALRLAAEARAKEASRELPKRPDRPITNGTARSELATLNAAIQWCFTENKITSIVPVWLPELTDSRERWLTRDEIAEMLHACRRLGPRYFHMLLFILIGVHCGQRKEAILSLQWQPNREGGYVNLRDGFIDFRKGQGHEGNSKSKKRQSRIPIPPILRVFLKAARKRTSLYVIEYEGGRLGDIKKAFAGIVAEAGLINSDNPVATPETVVVPHTLRHTCATWLVMRGIPLYDVGKWIGMSTDMVERVYGCHAPGNFDRVINARR